MGWLLPCYSKGCECVGESDVRHVLPPSISILARLQEQLQLMNPWSAGDAIRPIERKHTSCKGTCADTRYGVQQQPVLELVVDNG